MLAGQQRLLNNSKVCEKSSFLQGIFLVMAKGESSFLREGKLFSGEKKYFSIFYLCSAGDVTGDLDRIVKAPNLAKKKIGPGPFGRYRWSSSVSVGRHIRSILQIRRYVDDISIAGSKALTYVLAGR